ncbi:MAG: hypothetical protein Q4E33_04625 [Erysipelotrichaceae bacterium]|nr:hypothetical protein [Erysipelotrichaceae bacterium]
MFRNLSDLLSVVVLLIMCVYAFRLLVWSITYGDNQEAKRDSELFEMFKNYVDNEDE